MRKLQDMGRRAVALALAAGMTLSTVPSVLAADADEVLPPPAQTAEQEEADETAAPAEAEAPTESAEEADAPAVPAEDAPAVDSEIDTYAKLHTGECSFDGAVLEEVQPTCTEDGYRVVQCSKKGGILGLQCTQTQKVTLPKLDHVWDEGTVEQAFPCAEGIKTYHCTRDGCDGVKTETVAPTAEHVLGDWEVTKEPTCTEAGEKVRKCTVCGNVVETETLEPLSHVWDEGTVEQEFPCVEGVKTYHCTRGGCDGVKTETVAPTAEHVLGDWEVTKEPTCTEAGEKVRKCTVCGNVVETEVLEPLGHDWGEYVDDDKPGCEQQTETAHCTRCDAVDTRDIANVGSDGKPRSHKFTKFTTTLEEREKVVLGVTVKYKVSVTRAFCDYGCGTEKAYESDLVETGEIEALQAASDSVADVVAQKVNEALKKTEEEVRNAETKEEAVKALDTIYQETLDAIMGIKIGDTSIIDEATAEQLLSSLKSTLDNVQDSLNGSFLSKDSVQDTVSALVSAATSDSGTAATKKSAYELIFTQARGALNKEETADTDPIINDLILKMAQAAVGEDNKEALDAMTASLVDDVLDQVIDKLKKDDKYGKILSSKFGDEVLGDVDQVIKEKLLNDPEFMQQVRGIVQNAAEHANEGVNKGWSNDKILTNLRTDLSGDSGLEALVEKTITDLGGDVGDLVNDKLDDKVHKFLPGRLGDWVSDKLGGYAKDLVTKEVGNLNKDATNTVGSYLKYFTCGSKHVCDQYKLVKAPTCTEEGEYTYECQYCGWTSGGGKIPALGHTPVTDPGKAPTETEDGRTAGEHCSRCGEVLTAQQSIPMLDPSIETVLGRAATTEADAKAAGFDSVASVNAALDAALVQAGFDPADSEHFTVQVNSSIGVLPNDRFPYRGVTGTLTLPEGTRGKSAQNYCVVQVFTASNAGHKAGDVVVTPVKLLENGKNGMELTVYSEAVVAIAWKAQ